MIYVFYGHSGSGKTTLVNNLVDKGILSRVKTITTRPKRHNKETDYEFVHYTDFLKREAIKEIIGIRSFNVFLDNTIKTFNYGIPVKPLKAYANKEVDCAVIADARGVEELFDYFGNEYVVAVYIYGDKELLLQRASLRPDFQKREWERRYEADEPTLSIEEFDRNAVGDKFISGYKYFMIQAKWPPDKQIEHFELLKKLS